MKKPPVGFSFGFTLIEILIVLSLIGILFNLGVAKYNEFNRRQILIRAAQELKNNLRLAQNKALAGEKDCSGTLDGYRVSLSGDSYSIQSQCNGGTDFGPSTLFYFPEGVTKTSGASLILFKVLAQGAEIEGSPQIVLSGFGWTQTVTVTATGEIR